MLLRHYGRSCSVKKVHSDRDQNFCATDTNGEKFIIKFAHPDESHDEGCMQTEIMRSLAEQDFSVPVPHVIPAKSGEFDLLLECNGRTRMVRVIEFLPGTILSSTERTLKQSYNLGRISGLLTKSLTNFSHPGQDRIILPDIQHASRLRNYYHLIKDPAIVSLLEDSIRIFESAVKPKLELLRKQVVHNDIHGGNVLVDSGSPEKITGVIYFGDSVYTPLINDVVIGATSLLGVGGSFLDHPRSFIRGYDSVVKLTALEKSLLLDLTIVRSAITLILYAEWEAEKPENKEVSQYFLPLNVKQLKQLHGLRDKNEVFYSDSHEI